MRTLALIAALATLFTTTPLAVAERVEIRSDAPDRHVVVKGDTLWDISAKFLKSPWKWPEVWRLNKDGIHNPHLIYPGDVILLAYDADGQPRLTRIEMVRLSPQVRAEPIKRKDAIPTIPYEAIAPFLIHTTLISEADLFYKPQVLGTQDERTLLTPGDTIYASTTDGVTESWDVVRPGKALKSPTTGEVLAQEAEYAGRVRVVKHGNPATLRITETVGEIQIKDRLVPSNENALLNFVQHAPEALIDARIISAYGGVIDSISQFATVVIDKGRADGLREGSVLAVYRPGRIIDPSKKPKEYKSFKDEFADFMSPFGFFNRVHRDGRVGWRYMDQKCVKPGEALGFDFYEPEDKLADCTDAAARPVIYTDIGCLKPGKRISFDQPFNPRDVYDPHCKREPVIQLPDDRMGLIMVYRAFERVSYALVMQADGPIHLLDSARNP